MILPPLVFHGLIVIVSLPVEVAQWQNNQLIFLGSRVHIKEHLALRERMRGRISMLDLFRPGSNNFFCTNWLNFLQDRPFYMMNTFHGTKMAELAKKSE